MMTRCGVVDLFHFDVDPNPFREVVDPDPDLKWKNIFFLIIFAIKNILLITMIFVVIYWLFIHVFFNKKLSIFKTNFIFL